MNLVKNRILYIFFFVAIITGNALLANRLSAQNQFVAITNLGNDNFSGSNLLYSPTKPPIFKKKKHQHKQRSIFNGFIGPTLNFANVRDQYEFLLGCNAVLTIKDKVLIGGYGISNQVMPNLNIESEKLLKLNFWHAGGILGLYGYPFGGGFRHMFYVQGGVGKITIDPEGIVPSYDRFYIIIPTAEVNLSISYYLHIGLGINYAFAKRVQRRGLTNTDFSGFSMFITIKFGEI